MFFSPPFLIQCFCVLLLAFACLRLNQKKLFLPISICLSLTAIAVPSWFAIDEIRNYQREFPFVSIEDRLPKDHLPPQQKDLTKEAEEQLEQLEMNVELRELQRTRFRATQLKRLHENALQAFINSEGFGKTRVSYVFEWQLEEGSRTDLIPQPGERLSAEWFFDPLANPTTGDSSMKTSLSALHGESTLDFLNPGGFGYVKDRKQVAGFQGHGFSAEPEPARPEKLVSIELIGLVVHDEPVVYISQYLPNMKALGQSPTRMLDEFETAGLQALKDGKHMYAQDFLPGTRAVGAIRATNQCITCHNVQRGDLLGAFSYTFRKR